MFGVPRGHVPEAGKVRQESLRRRQRGHRPGTRGTRNSAHRRRGSYIQHLLN